jgi:hypothetical protein
MTQPIVVVLGMHRSGTSLLANILNVLGIDFGQQLLPANLHNEAGYWEQTEIYQTQEALLHCLGRNWSGPAWTNPFPLEWHRVPELQPFKDQLIAIIRKELAQTKGVWGFKDPRTSRLLPLWKEIFDELQLEPLYLLAVREPSAVVESILKRDGLPASRAELLWLLHNHEAVRDAGAGLRLVVDYDRWFTAPREQSRVVAEALNLPWPDSADTLVAEIQQRIRPELRHCQAPLASSLLPFVTETYAALRHAAFTGTHAGLCDLQTHIERALSLCTPWLEAINEVAFSRQTAGVVRKDGQAASFPGRDEFDEPRYLSAHQDVAEAVRQEQCASGWDHFVHYGFAEGRCWFQNTGRSGRSHANE